MSRAHTTAFANASTLSWSPHVRDKKARSIFIDFRLSALQLLQLNRIAPLVNR
jgi:hypothetical protein